MKKPKITAAGINHFLQVIYIISFDLNFVFKFKAYLLAMVCK